MTNSGTINFAQWILRWISRRISVKARPGLLAAGCWLAFLPGQVASEPFPILTQSCGEEYDLQVEESQGEIAKHHGEVKFMGKGKAKAVKALLKYLKERNKEVRAHEIAHYRHAGKYADQPKYYFYTFRGVKYVIAGCVHLHQDIPPEVAFKAALAPKEPSQADLRLAQWARQQIASRGK